MEEVIRLPAAEAGPGPGPGTARTRRRAAGLDPGGEERKRQKNVGLVSVLGEEDGSVKVLEELVFGAEPELLGRLLKVSRRSLG